MKGLVVLKKKIMVSLLVIATVVCAYIFANSNQGNCVKKPVTQDEILEFDTNVDYANLMIDAACQSDFENGREYERLRNLKLSYYSKGNYIKFDDLYLLAKIVQHEAGSSWLTAEHRKMVASVVMNRVDSPEFPNTIYEVVYQKGQYAGIWGQGFKDLIPSKDSVLAAFDVLENGSVMPGNVVFQSEFPQGGGIYKIVKDKYLGTTYFCYSNNKKLYK